MDMTAVANDRFTRALQAELSKVFKPYPVCPKCGGLIEHNECVECGTAYKQEEA